MITAADRPRSRHRMDLEARDVTHSYEDLLVLEGVSLHVRSGEIVAVIGPSGCGKSTLLRILGGLERPSAGEALVRGAAPAGSLNPLTYVFQDFALLPWRTVWGNVALPLEARGLARAEREARVDAALARTGPSPPCCCWTSPCRRSTPRRASCCSTISPCSGCASASRPSM